MMNRYAFSVDRESFRGEYSTRELAVAAGLDAARELPSVEAIYVGKKTPVDTQTDDHAETVVKSMRRRMLEEAGDANWLGRANEHVLADLDAALEHAIVDWLRRHQLTPADKITAISEHPIPTVAAHAPDRNTEPSMIGPEE
jgi:hypothetical protein